MSTQSSIGRILTVVGFSTLLMACGSAYRSEPGVVYQDQNQSRSSYCQNCGVVASVETVAIEDEGIGLGAVIGAVVGAAAGSQVGDGSGKKAATAAGAVAGGVAGHEIQKRNRDAKLGYRFIVTLDDGRTATVTQEDSYGLDYGDRVQIIDDEIVPA